MMRAAWLLLLLVIPSRSVAQDLHPGSVVWRDGARGMWWPLETALVLRAEHLAVPLLEEQRDSCYDRVSLLDEKLSLAEEERDDARAEVAAVYDEVEASLVERDDAYELVDATVKRAAAAEAEVARKRRQLVITAAAGAGALLLGLVIGGFAL